MSLAKIMGRKTTPSILLALLVVLLPHALSPIIATENESISRFNDQLASNEGAILGFQSGTQGTTFSSGLEHSCWISIDDYVNCEGSNNRFQLGSIYSSAKSTRFSLGDLGAPISISSGNFHNCAITERSLVVCWGWNERGQSSGSLENELQLIKTFAPPSAINLGGDAATAVSSGGNHSCSLTIGGGVWCWGSFFNNDNSGIQETTAIPRIVIDPPFNRAISISSGENHACSVMIDRSLWCWGAPMSSIPSPIKLENFNENLAVSSEGDTTCSLNFSGGLRCFSWSVLIEKSEFIDKYNINGTNISIQEPIVVSTGGFSVCIVGVGGESQCWGKLESLVMPQIRPSLSIGGHEYCFVESDSIELTCEQTQPQSTNNRILGEVKLFTLDLDNDDVLDHMDDFPRDSSKSRICPPGKFGLHICEESPPGHFVSTSGSVKPEQCPPGTYQDRSGQTTCVYTPAGSFSESSGSITPSLCPPGTFSDEIGLTSGVCQPTEPGTWSPGGIAVQLNCQPGSYQPNWGQSNCTLSLPGRFSPNKSAIIDFPCPEGKFQLMNGQAECHPADPGNFVDKTGSSGQTPCPAGTYLEESGSRSSNSCEPTPPGTFSHGGSKSPLDCPRGTFQPSWQEEACTAASPGNFVQSNGSDSQIPCPSGTYQSEYGQYSCLDSSEGFFVSDIGNTNMTPCPRGTFQPNQGMSDCIPSEPGFYVGEVGSSLQTPCPEGTYSSSVSSEDISACIITQPGNYSNIGSSEQISCEIGTFQPDYGQGACLPAEIGFFVDQLGSTIQIQCPTETTTIGQSSQSLGDCVGPLPGNYIVDSESAMPCPAGTFQPLPAQTFCLDASAGFFVENIGSPEQVPCPPGTYSDIVGASSGEVCVLAELGFYSPGGLSEPVIAEPGFYTSIVGSESQTPCPAGSYSEVIGATSEEDCQTTPPGTFSLAGSSAPNLCPKGTYQPDSGQNSCLDASPGNFSGQVGQVEQLDCPLGHFQPESAMSFCDPAGFGFYVPVNVTQYRLECPQNMTTLGEESVSIISCISDSGHYVGPDGEVRFCPKGYYQNAPGQTSCETSLPGYYVDELASAVQKKCPQGSYNENYGGTSIYVCILASPGYYSDHEGINEIPCPIGSFQPESGMADCRATDPGFYSSEIASISQKPCLPGTFQPSGNSSVCLLTDPGNFSDIAASVEQFECSRGTYQPTSGSFQCILSDPGNFVPENGSISQIGCPPGSYQPDSNSWKCLPVSDGYFAYPQSRDQQIECAPGSYRNSLVRGGADICLISPKGTYSGPGSAEPTSCPPGTYSPIEGSTSSVDCILASPGFFVDVSGSAQQTPCEPGSYQPDTSAISCITAPLDSFVPDYGSETYRPCSSSGYTISSGSTSSMDCIFDQDGDGILDRDDPLVNLEGDSISNFYKILMLSLNVILVATVPRGSLNGD